jgi:hypothetical protein
MGWPGAVVLGQTPLRATCSPIGVRVLPTLHLAQTACCSWNGGQGNTPSHPQSWPVVHSRWRNSRALRSASGSDDQAGAPLVFGAIERLIGGLE